MAKIVTLLACVGALGVAMEASTQTVNHRLGTLPFARDGLTRETAPTLYDVPDVQRPVGFAPQDSRGLNRFHLLAATERSAGGGGGSGAAPSDGQAHAAELAKKLQNPVADLISVPLQNNWDFGIGPADAMRYTVNIQPVIPVSLTTDWNLIIRTILPVIYAESPRPRWRQQGRPGGYHAELLLLAESADQRRLDLGRRPGVPLSQRHG